ncbi:hypothetical protein [Streptomyces sp. NRRL F-2580]|uniref:hypothetical protein n=1 Tax=Streptomyces sp. NRRL F-2580 TaxID=1463841 RepID=UPI0004C8DD1F|nr:hypothetical protein [Streptomyces sp. NRRL F-2580]
MKAYEGDRAAVREEAEEAAHQPTHDDRMAHMEVVWGMCGIAANGYHCPPAVAEMLVKEAVSAFLDSRTALILDGVAA